MQETEEQVAEVTEKITSIKNRREERQRKKRTRKALIAAITALCVLFGTAAYTGLHHKSVAEADDNMDVRETTGGSMSGKTVILHSGGVHGAVDGYSKMASLKKELEDAGADVVVVDAGGFSSGTTGDGSFSTVDGFKMMRSVGYNAATLGESEFAEGYDKLRSDISGAKMRLICANVFKDDKSILNPDFIYEATNGSKIGFFALTSPADCDGLNFLSGDEMYSLAKTEVDSLNKGGADVVIALGHLGTESSAELYKNVDGIDFIIDGQSQAAMTEGADGEPIQSGGEGFAYIGVIVVGSNGSIEDHYIMSTESFNPDEAVQADADKIKENAKSGESKDTSDQNEDQKADEEVMAEEENNAEEAKMTEEKTAGEAETAEENIAEEDKTTEETNAVGAEEKSVEAESEAAEDKSASGEAAGEETAAEPEENRAAADEQENAGAEENTTEEQKAADELASLKDGKYEVVKGDCLWNIAKKYLGDGARWGEIYELNKGIISNPSLIYVGQQLVLPPG